MLAVSKAQQKATNKYISRVYDRVNLTMPKGRKDDLQAFAAREGESVNAFINRAIAQAMGGIFVQEKQPCTSSILSPDVLKQAQDGANAAGEELPAFVERAVTAQIQRDKLKRQFDSESDDPEKALARLRERYAEQKGGAENEQPRNGA